MNPRRACRAVAILGVGLFFVATILSPQQTANRIRIGVPQDWSHRHIVFSRDALLKHPEVMYQEPRVLHEAIQRWQGRYSSIVPGVDTPQTPSVGSSVPRDWNLLLPGGRLAANMFPAKYSFDAAAPPSCLNDFVVFGTTKIGVVPPLTGGAPNLIALNNLYSGTGGACAAAPSVLFAYNTTTVTGGHILTSPVLSEDGTKIAFVESAVGPPASAIFHVLTWTRGDGTLTNAATPNMTSTFLAAAQSTTSSPWVDYKNDTVYVGANDGNIYKITGVFKGTPALAGAPWPVTVVTNLRLTPPVLDASLGLLMVGGSNGSLYQITTTGTTAGAVKHLVIAAGTSGTNHGILAPPIVDVTNRTTFVVSSNDGSSGVLVEADTLLLTELARGRIGEASHSGTAINIYEPALSDSYYNDPSTGVIRLCGTGDLDVNPYQYAFSFSGRIMQTPFSFRQQLATTTSTPPAHCTPWTEFPNINLGIDFFFFGLTADCTTPGAGTADGCVMARSSDAPPAKATLAGGPSGIIADNFSTLPQASSIYMMSALANHAYKFTQNGLGP